jgi:autotransporter-associated beta strand protein
MKINAQRARHDVSLKQVSQNTKFFPTTILHLLVMAILLIAGSATAGQLVWDPLNNTGTTPAGSNWDTLSGNTVWYNGSSDVAWTQSNTTVGLNGAIFGGMDGNWGITNDVGQIAVTNLTINNSGYTFYGAALDITSGDIMTLAAGKTVTFNCNLAADNNAKDYIAGSGAVVNIVGSILGQQPKLIGPGSYYLSAVNTPSVLYNLAPVFLTNGSITTSASFFVGYPATVNGTSYTTGSLTISGGASATQNGNVLMVGRGGGNGTLTLLNGTVNVGTSAMHDLAICYDGNGGESGTLNVYGGTVNVGSSSLASKLDFYDTAGSGAGATAIMTQTNGVVNAWGGVIFGAASGTFSGGTAALTNTGGFLYVGSAGINRAAGFPPSISVSLSGGTVAALASWSSSLPMTLATNNGNITFQCADSGNTPWNISLSGPLAGAGGLYVNGGGTLTLSGSNTYTGSTVVSNGTLAIVTSASPTNGLVIVDGSTGFPALTLSNAPGSFWSIGGLTFQNTTTATPALNFQFGSLSPSTSVAPVQVSGNAAFTATPNVSVGGAAIAPGTYPLIQYTGALSGIAPSTVSLPAYASGYLTNIAASKTVALVVTGSTYKPALYWAVGNGVWDINTTANWKGNSVKYTDGSAVVFDDSASGSSPITVTLNTVVNPLDVTFNNSIKNYIITGSGSVAGSGTLQLLGSGTVTLACTNAYAGGTGLNAGQLNINNGGNANATAIGTGPLTLNAGASIDNTSGSNVTLQASIPETWNGNFTYVGSATNFNTGVGPVTMGGIISLAVNSNNFTVGGSISDNGANYQLIKTGNGALTLPVPSYYGGGFTLQSGQLNIGDPGCIGSGIFEIVTGTIDNVSGAAQTLSPASYVWVNNFTFLGTTNLDLGYQTIVDASGPLTVTIVSNIFSTEGSITSGNSVITKAGNGTWVIGGGYSSTHQLQLSVSAGQVNLAKSANAIGIGSSGLTVLAGGLALDINSSQIYHGSGTYVPVTLNGGVWDLNGQNETVDKMEITNGGTLQNSATGSTSTLAMDTTNMFLLGGANCQFNVAATGTMNINATIAGTGSLVKNGLGLLNLTTNNAYTGNTLINNGTIALPGMSSISTTAAIELTSTNSALDLSNTTDTNGFPDPVLTLLGGQTLSGFGTVTGLVQTVIGSTLAPGSVSAVGTLTVTGVTGTNTLNGTTMMKLKKSSHANDQLAVSGSLAYGGTLVLTNLSGSLVVGDSFTLFSAAGGYSGTFAGLIPSRPGFPAFGLAWNTNNLAVNGTLSIVAASVPPSPKITSVSLSGGMLSILGTNGVPNEPFVLLGSTNLAVPLSSWTPVQTNAFNGSGNFSISVAVTNGPDEFFTLFVQ